MTEPTKNTNPKISAEIAGIGYLSPRRVELKEVADIELSFILEHIKTYTKNEQIFILDVLSSKIASYLIDYDG